MKERPIIFSTDSVRTILEGRKTQTRRVMKSPPEPIGIVAPKKIVCPFGTMGDRLWVREKWSRDNFHGIAMPDVIYAADFPDDAVVAAWQNPMFMPRKYSRLTLEIVNVGYQRLQSMWHHDARDEGYGLHPDCLKWYREAWDKLNAKRGYDWESNPWVWVIKFKKVETALDKTGDNG